VPAQVGCVCDDDRQPPVPGEEKSVFKSILDTGSEALQKFAPVSRICQHVCGLHFYAHDMTRQVSCRFDQ
jgi:hypothetical protein